MAERILVGHHLSDGSVKCVQRAMEAIGDGELLEMQPEALNGIEKWTIFGQPDHHQAVLEKTQGCLSRFAVVVGGVIHDQNDLLAGIFRQQMLKKGNKRIAVFVSSGEEADATRMPVIPPEHM